MKWQPQARDYIWQEYRALTNIAVDENPDLIIWPEAALPGILGKDEFLRSDLESLGSSIKVPLLFGAVNLKDNNYYNSAILMSEKARFIKRYDKLHLVPFGEYIPLRDKLPLLETVVPIGDFNSGKEYTVFTLGLGAEKAQRVNFSVLICFEDIFAEISRQFVRRGASFLVNITNDAWFKNTSSPYQHLSASVFRALENRVCLVRAANTVVSGFITPWGMVYSLSDGRGHQTFIKGFATENIHFVNKKRSLYTKWGDWLVLVCFLFMIYVFLKIKLCSKKY